MLRHQPRPPSPWGACTLAVAALLLLLLLVPAAWWRTLWLSTRPALDASRIPAVATDFTVLEIAAPRTVEAVVPADEKERERPRDLPDAAWWDHGWDVRVRSDLLGGPATAAADTTPWARLGALGLPTSLQAALTVPDSVLAARIWELVWEDRVDLSQLADYFRAIGRGRAYADLRSREAAMFGEFLFETVPITETGDD
jgi:hypothetical protein